MAEEKTQAEVISDLVKIKHVGEATARKFYDAGVWTTEEVATMAVPSLTSITGTTKSNAEEMKISAGVIASASVGVQPPESKTVGGDPPMAVTPPMASIPEPNVVEDEATIFVPKEIRLQMLARQRGHTGLRFPKPQRSAAGKYAGGPWNSRLFQARVCPECYEFRSYDNPDIAKKRKTGEPMQPGSAHHYGMCFCDIRGTFSMAMSGRPRGLQKKIAEKPENMPVFAAALQRSAPKVYAELKGMQAERMRKEAAKAKAKAAASA